MTTEATSPTERPVLSVVIPTMGRDTVVPTVQSLIGCTRFPEMDIIVAGRIRNDDVRNAIAEFLKRHENIRHLDIQFETGDSSRKKNEGAAVAKADLVAFLDDDVVAAPDWPDEILRAFERPDVGLVSGPGLVPEDINPIGRLAGLALSSRAAGYVSYRYSRQHADVRPIRWSKIIGCNMVYRKSVFDEMGRFDPGFWPGEEMMASFKTERLGYRLMFNPSAVVYHYPRQSLRRFWRQIWGYGLTRTRLIRMGAPFEWTTVVPGVWVFSLLVFGIGSLFYPWFLWLLLADLAAYALVDLFITIEMVARTRRWLDVLLLFMIPYMHLSYGLAEWAELLRPNRDLSER